MSARGVHNGPLRRRGALQRWEERFGPNMTPMVDVVLVILIFFMAGTALVGDEWVLRAVVVDRGTSAGPSTPRVELPEVRLNLAIRREAGPGPAGGAGGSRASAVSSVVTGLDAEGKGLSLDEFEGAILRFTEGTDVAAITVVIAPGPEVPYRDVIRVHEACAKAGITKIGVVP